MGTAAELQDGLATVLSATSDPKEKLARIQAMVNSLRQAQDLPPPGPGLQTPPQVAPSATGPTQAASDASVQRQVGCVSEVIDQDAVAAASMRASPSHVSGSRAAPSQIPGPDDDGTVGMRRGASEVPSGTRGTVHLLYYWYLSLSSPGVVTCALTPPAV